MDRVQAAKDRLLELNEPVADNLARTKFLSEEEFIASVQGCANCVFYRRHGGIKRSTSSSGKSTEFRWDKNFCKRNPPTVVVARLVQHDNALIVESQTTWPETKRTDWCAEHQPLPGFDEAVPPKSIQGFRPSDDGK